MKVREREVDALKHEIAQHTHAAALREETIRILKTEKDSLLSSLRSLPSSPATLSPPPAHSASLSPSPPMRPNEKAQWKGIERALASSALHEEMAAKTKEFQKSLFFRSERVEELLMRASARKEKASLANGIEREGKEKGKEERRE